MPTPETRNSILAQPQAAGERLREAMILALCLTRPAVVAEFESQLERIDFADPLHARLCDAILEHAPDARDDPARLKAAVAGTVGADGVEKLLAQPHLRIAPPLRHAERIDAVRLALAEQIAMLTAERGARAEMDEAMRDIAAEPGEGLTWRLEQASRARDTAPRTALGADRSEYEIADNGVRLRREERDRLKEVTRKFAAKPKNPR